MQILTPDFSGRRPPPPQTVISHSFAKAKTQVGKGSRKPAKEPQKNSVAKAFAKVEFLVHVVLFIWVTIFLCRQPQQASQPASQPASRSRPASSSGSTSVSGENRKAQTNFRESRAKASRKQTCIIQKSNRGFRSC